MTLTLTNIAKTFPGGTKALLPTDLEIAKGEILSLLGPSGCGKSTLLRIIAGLETPDPGASIVFDGDDVTHQSVESRKIGMVFQSYALFPNMSVRSNIGYGLKMQKLPKAEIAARVDEVIGLCQLAPYADRAVTALSGGQKQRVALARAMAPRPRVLLLDEPLSALDAALRNHLRDELALLLRQFGITAIFVTHDQDEAMAIADRVAVMSQGQVAQIGTPEALYRNPATGFVARFVGDAMPLEGRIERAHMHLPGGVLTLPQAGDGQQVLVRAEDISIDPQGPITGRVETVTFLGTHYRIALSGVMAGPLFMLHAGLSAPKPGDEVRLSIPPEALLVLPMEMAA
ncbi:ABC transporter ATP-binding protein [Tritonibacter scottomollicae]|uniref:Putative spermidine/putrescine transport system ATP-binding protein n=1 Tax=Tritonibacter scottomollicae TaxID=483013 RepID=A0A2T1ANR6_TRISK|nr:ABC transporter ATP-binding protein [Tritonibacter scottomollicae]PRZ50212.1 putative spermidine/putrescine transport system ATP-binding protein [Tritonibacter scottomollicae]